LNAANEIAVEAFLDNKMRFVDIPRLIEEVLSSATIQDANSLAEILSADLQARDAMRAALSTQKSLSVASN
jgi:1-deoxy-D-xylulose-5-phosphate reductoisomerase